MRSLPLAALLVACAAGGPVRVDPDAGTADSGTLDSGTSGVDSAITPDASSEDSGGLDSGGLDSGGLDSGGLDSGGLDSGATDAGTDARAADAGPPPPPGPGSYLYRRIPVGGMHEAVVAAFHPDGSYAIVLERDTTAIVYDWATEVATRIDLRVAGRALVLTDVSFDPGGGSALITAYERVASTDTGVLIRADDAAIRAGMGAASFTRLGATRTGERFVAIERPPPGEGPVADRPIVLSQSGPTPGYIARLRDLDATGAFGAFIEARPSSAGCDDLAFADNELGTWGIVLVCGTNGADAPYYTQIGGVGEWRAGPAATLGNASRAATHGAGDYALAISWSGRDLDRFEAGAWRPSGTAPGWTTLGVYDVSFASDGARALIVGRASGGAALRGTALEFRHDLYSTAAITDVSIPGFGSAPYLGGTNTNLNDSAFRPGCDGGIVVGGETSFSGSTGLLIEFSIEAARACRP